MVKKFILLGTIISTVSTISAQDLRVNIFGGAANYNGDLQERNFTLNQAKYAAGAWLSYDISPKIMLRGGLHFASIGASDQYQTELLRRLRNLSFKTNIWELQAGAEYHFLGMDTRVFSPYVFGSVAGFRFNPFAIDQAGNKVFLKPLSTEGQGVAGYPDRKPYQLVQFAVPFGLGLRMSLTEKFDVGAEIGYRKTFTDYMDDVSKSYIDQAALLTARGPKAVEMAFRTDEIPTHASDPYPVDLEKRGSPTFKDNYYFMGITLSYRITNNNSSGGKFNGKAARGYGGKRRSNMGCPNNVW
jgi:hypothetical protein